MRSYKKHLFGIAVGLLVMSYAVIFTPRAESAWLRISGAVIAEGSRTHTYTHKPIRMMSVMGRRWASWNEMEGAYAYHALVIFPQAEIKNEGWATGGDGFTYTNLAKWRVWSKQQSADISEVVELGIVYDAIWRTITIASKTYNLDDGNMFVIRFDEKRHPLVTQLNTILNKDIDVEEVMDVFKSELPGDAVLQQP